MGAGWGAAFGRDLAGGRGEAGVLLMTRGLEPDNPSRPFSGSLEGIPRCLSWGGGALARGKELGRKPQPGLSLSLQWERWVQPRPLAGSELPQLRASCLLPLDAACAAWLALCWSSVGPR